MPDTEASTPGDIDQLVNLFANKFKKLRLQNEEALPISRYERRSNLLESIEREELLFNAVDVSMLPDRGEKIIKRIENLRTLLAKLDEKIANDEPPTPTFGGEGEREKEREREEDHLEHSVKNEGSVQADAEELKEKEGGMEDVNKNTKENKEEVVGKEQGEESKTDDASRNSQVVDNDDVVLKDGEQEGKKKSNELDVLIDKVTGRLEGLKLHSKNELPPPSLEYLQKQEEMRMIGQVGKLELEMRRKEGKKSTIQLSVEESIKLCKVAFHLSLFYSLKITFHSIKKSSTEPKSA